MKGRISCKISNSKNRFASQGSRDNMSIVIVNFPGAPKVSEEAVKKEQQLDNRIEAKIKGRCDG